jgi:hypothetical protein
MVLQAEMTSTENEATAGETTAEASRALRTSMLSTCETWEPLAVLHVLYWFPTSHHKKASEAA